jgi:hypothetical protein
MRTFIKWLKSLKKEKWECYEIHVVQARIFKCNSQCKECKLRQESKNK